MKKFMERLLSFLLVISVCAGFMPVYAADSCPNTWTNTGDQLADIIGVATTQVGYAAPSENHSKYNAWYYGSDETLGWCSTFISWCAAEAGIGNDVIQETNWATGIDLDFNPFGGSIYRFGEVSPQPGDIITTVTSTGTAGSNHTALVVAVDDTYIYTIEGNRHTDGVGYVARERYLVKSAEDGAAGYEAYIWPSGRGRSVSSYIHILYVIRPNYHKFSEEIVAPTCTKGGYTKRVCSICGATETYHETAPVAHTYGKGVLTREMTASQDGIITYTCQYCGAERYETLPAGGSQFLDVQDRSCYYYQPVIWGAGSGIVYGTGAYEFSPDAFCSRAQVITFLYRAAGEPEVSDSESPFTDVKKSDYFYRAVLWGYQQHIVYGMSASTFCPDDTVSRAQFITFLHRYAKLPLVSQADSTFLDLPEDGYYTEAVRWGEQTGIVAGIDSTHFGPDQSCTRAQVVTFLYRYMHQA